MEITNEQAELLDSFLETEVENISLNSEYGVEELMSKLNVNEQLAERLLLLINSTEINGVQIIKPIANGQYFFLNENAIDFIRQGGYANIYNQQQQEKEEQKIFKVLEINNLKLGPKQYKFNKFSVIANTILTLITIILTVLIATGVIE